MVIPLDDDDNLLAEIDRNPKGPIDLEHPRTKQRYVMVTLAEYERLKPSIDLLGRLDGTGGVDRRSKLVNALKNLSPDMRQKLAQLKSEGEVLRARPDLLWYLLVQCASTWGNARGAFNLFGDKELLRTVSFDALARLPPERRERQILATLQKAKVRMPPKKAVGLALNFKRIEEMGGVEKASQIARRLQSREQKLSFVKSFYGIGEKYGRNLWMDIYDPHFRDTIAVDQRIKNITAELGCTFRNYADYEDFYRAIARDANLEPWEVDRLLFWFTDHFLSAIKA